MNLCRPWPQGSRSGGVAGVADRVRYGGAYGRLPPMPSVFRKIPTLSVQARSREELLRKTRTSPSWPRRGRRGLRRRRGAFSYGGSRSYGGRAFAALTNSIYCRRWGLRPRLGPSGNTAGRWRKDRGTPTRKSPVTDNGYKKPAPLPSIGGAEGTGGNYPG